MWDIICKILQNEIYGLSTKQQFHRDIENGTDNQQNDMWLYHALSANGIKWKDP